LRRTRRLPTEPTACRNGCWEASNRHAALSRRWVIEEGPVAWLPGDSMRCSNCGSENPAGAKFCDGCAAPLPLRCPLCGVSNRASAKFCIECAAPLGAVTVAARSSGAAQPARPEKDTIALGARLGPHDVPEGERKTVTAFVRPWSVPGDSICRAMGQAALQCLGASSVYRSQ
jgi:Double zinc ribbon